METGGYILYLILLLVLVGGYFFRDNDKLKNINHLITWALIILLLTLGYRAYERFTSTPRQIGSAEAALRIPYNAREGGFVVQFQANSHATSGIIDTGATAIVLSFEDAQAAGLDMNTLSFDRTVSTANGITTNARARLDKLAFGDQIFENVDVLVAQQGALEESLLGLALLRRFSGFSIADDTLLIEF